MWIFTKHGFFSAVCAKQGDGRHGEQTDPDRLMVRARVRAHLEALKIRFPSLLGASEILSFAGTDYAFRIFVTKETWVQVVAGLAEDIDYGNFKSAVARHEEGSGSAYGRSLHDVWSVMYRLQESSRKRD